MNKHKTTINAKCPHGGPDFYEACFESSRMIPVEVIQASIECLTKSPVYQEDLTGRLSSILQCEVILIGKHKNFVTETNEGKP